MPLSKAVRDLFALICSSRLFQRTGATTEKAQNQPQAEGRKTEENCKQLLIRQIYLPHKIIIPSRFTAYVQLLLESNLSLGKAIVLKLSPQNKCYHFLLPVPFLAYILLFPTRNQILQPPQILAQPGLVSIIDIKQDQKRFQCMKQQHGNMDTL